MVAGIYHASKESKSAGHFIPDWDTYDWERFIPSSRNLLIRKSVWEIVGGYPEFLTKTGEDTLFAILYRQHSQLWVYNKTAFVRWHGPACMNEALQLAYSYGYGDGESGYGDVHFYKFFKRFVVSGERPKTIDILSAEVAGYLEGRQQRPKRELSCRNLQGLVIILSGVPMTDSGGGQRGAQMALEFARRKYKVIYVNVYPSFESPHTIYFDVDLTLIELYHLGDFDIQNVLEAYEPLMDRAIILLEFPHPDFVSLVEETKRRERRPKIIYDYIDNWNSSLGWTWYTPETESKIIGMTDHLIASAVTLQEELKQRTKRYVSLIPNAFNSQLFDPDRSYVRPSDLPVGFEQIVLYVGSLWGEWFDWDLLNFSADAMPNAAFVLIGDSSPGIHIKVASKLRNVFFIGLKPQSALPPYLSYADVCIIPFKNDNITKYVNPLKVYEYLSMRKRVVTTPMEGLEALPGVRISSSRQDFIVNLKLSSMLEEIVDRSELVSKHSWEARCSELIKFVQSAFPIIERHQLLSIPPAEQSDPKKNSEGIIDPNSPKQEFSKTMELQIKDGRIHEEDYWILKSFRRAEDTAVDIGANSGQSIISIRTVNPVIKIVSFEPNPLLVDILQKLKNYYSNLEIHTVGLGDSEEVRDFYTPVVDGLLITPLASLDLATISLPEQKQYIQQLGTRPDVYLLRESIQTLRGDSFRLNPSFMKIDAEGFELNIVKGFVNTISQFRPVLMIEKSRFICEIDAFLTDLGYARYRYVMKENMLTLLPPINNCCGQSEEVPLNVFFVHERQLADMCSRGIKVS